MSGQPTRAGFASRIPAPWRVLAQFVRRPVLPDRANLTPAPALRSLFALFALDLALMGLLLGALSLALALGFKMPEHVLGELSLKPALVAIIVLAAPIGEEIAFRGWLSGRIGHILATPLTIVALFAIPVAAVTVSVDSGRAVVIGASAAVALLLAGLALYSFRKRNALGFFQRHFAWFYWASVLAFAAVHLSNFAAAGVSVLPLVLPQFMLALILGYLRVNYGLWSSVLTHMLHNTLFIGLVLAGAG